MGRHGPKFASRAARRVGSPRLFGASEEVRNNHFECNIDSLREVTLEDVFQGIVKIVGWTQLQDEAEQRSHGDKDEKSNLNTETRQERGKRRHSNTDVETGR